MIESLWNNPCQTPADKSAVQSSIQTSSIAAAQSQNQVDTQPDCQPGAESSTIEADTGLRPAAPNGRAASLHMPMRSPGHNLWAEDNGDVTSPEHTSYRASTTEMPLTPETTWPTLRSSPVDLTTLITTPRHNGWAECPDRVSEAGKGSHGPDVPRDQVSVPSLNHVAPASSTKSNLSDRSSVDRSSTPSPPMVHRQKRSVNSARDINDSPTPQTHRTRTSRQDQAAAPQTPKQPVRYQATVESASESDLRPELVASEDQRSPETPWASPPRSQARRTSYSPRTPSPPARAASPTLPQRSPPRIKRR